MKPTVLFIGRESDWLVPIAREYCRAHCEMTESNGNVPAYVLPHQWDYILNVMGEGILPESLLSRAKIAALNFHPGPPEYPGRGCVNFALYDNARTFGATCHHMIGAVDAGTVVEFQVFPIYPTDTVETVLQRTHATVLHLFYYVMELILEGAELPVSPLQWTRKPTTRADLNKLATITADMDELEIEHRIRATSYKQWKPEMLFRGKRWELK